MSSATTADTAAGAMPRRPRLWPASPAGRGVAGLAILVILLEVLPRLGVVNREFVPPVSEWARALGQQLGSAAFWTQLGQTMRGWAIGFSIALVAGVSAGIVIGSIPVLRQATASTIEFLRAIPSVALIPLAVLLFGTDMKATLVLVIYASFWQILVQVLYGVQDVDPVARDTARVYQLGSLAQVRNVIWPTALPYVMTGFRLAASVALVLEITGELIIGSPGLGNAIAVAQSSGMVAEMYALVVVAGVLGVLMNFTARTIQGRVLRWHPSMRAEL